MIFIKLEDNVYFIIVYYSFLLIFFDGKLIGVMKNNMKKYVFVDFGCYNKIL